MVDPIVAYLYRTNIYCPACTLHLVQSNLPVAIYLGSSLTTDEKIVTVTEGGGDSPEPITRTVFNMRSKLHTFCDRCMRQID